MTLVEQARAILRANDRGGYCVPTARLYPFQWNWDSAFVAMGWATFDEAPRLAGNRLAAARTVGGRHDPADRLPRAVG